MTTDDFVAGLEEAARNPDWRAMLQCGDKGPRANLFNVMMALRHCPDLKGAVRLNSFRLETDVTAPLPWDDKVGREWTRFDDLHFTEWLQSKGIGVKTGEAAEGIEAIASESAYHPVRDWLEGLEWDGVERVRDWLTTYLGCEPLPYYTSEVGQRWLLSAIARIFKPGCKADHCLVLEGDQGKGKSTALRTLFGNEWFTDEIADLGGKDAAMQTRGVWLIELGELEHLSRQEVGRVKAFLSRTVDRFRPPYGRRLIMAPRECVFAGTVNDRQYLKDETGNRRFWPVRVGRVDLKAIIRDRAQLWAEALHLYRGGASWWLNSLDLVDAAREEQEARCSVDPWADRIADYVADKGETFVGQLLVDGVSKKLSECTRADEMRVAKIMQQLGWIRARQKGPQRRWCYQRTTDAEPPAEPPINPSPAAGPVGGSQAPPPPDPWRELVSRHVAGLSEVTVDALLKLVVGGKPEDWTRAQQSRLGKVMTALHWEPSSRTGLSRREAYRRTADAGPPETGG